MFVYIQQEEYRSIRSVSTSPDLIDQAFKYDEGITIWDLEKDKEIVEMNFCYGSSKEYSYIEEVINDIQCEYGNSYSELESILKEKLSKLIDEHMKEVEERERIRKEYREKQEYQEYLRLKEKFEKK